MSCRTLKELFTVLKAIAVELRSIGKDKEGKLLFNPLHTKSKINKIQIIILYNPLMKKNNGMCFNYDYIVSCVCSKCVIPNCAITGIKANLKGSSALRQSLFICYTSAPSPFKALKTIDGMISRMSGFPTTNR